MVLTYGEPKKGYLNFTLGNLWATQPIVLLNLATLVVSKSVFNILTLLHKVKLSVSSENTFTCFLMCCVFIQIFTRIIFNIFCLIEWPNHIQMNLTLFQSLGFSHQSIIPSRTMPGN